MVNVGGLHGHGDRDLVAVVLLPRVDGDDADCIVTIDPVRPRETKTARLTRELSEALKQQAATAVVGFLAAVRARQAAALLPRRPEA